MIPGLDAASIFTARQDPPAEVAQFEPDFDGTWDPPAVAGDSAEVEEWIVWPSQALVAAWAGDADGPAGL